MTEEQKSFEKSRETAQKMLEEHQAKIDIPLELKYTGEAEIIGVVLAVILFFSVTPNTSSIVKFY